MVTMPGPEATSDCDTSRALDLSRHRPSIAAQVTPRIRNRLLGKAPFNIQDYRLLLLPFGRPLLWILHKESLVMAALSARPRKK